MTLDHENPSEAEMTGNPMIPGGMGRVESEARGTEPMPEKKAKQGRNEFESFQDVIAQSMREAQQIHTDRLGANGDFSNTSILVDTMKDIQNAASGTYTSIKEWAAKSSSQGMTLLSTPDSLDNPPASPSQPLSSTPGFDSSHMTDPGMDSEKQATGGEPGHQIQKEPHLRQVSWPVAICDIVSGQLSKGDDLAPHITKMKEAVAWAVNGDLDAANDIWKFASGARDDDENTVGTFDTLQEENNQIRRLASWGTINTAGTGGTNDTGMNSLDQGKTPTEIRFHVEDDDGNFIDPVLLEKAQKQRERRAPRREKLVKFDYPPIKSLKQCPRPNPEDLPDLFFTEHELDQIEDDRYCTMSTDDIEIVAVASREAQSESDQPKANKGKPQKSAQGDGATFANPPESTPPSIDTSNGRDSPLQETTWKQTRGRPSTPHRRRRPEDDEDADFPTHQSKSSGKGGRLVKGVQIYLRERSTGT